MSSYGRGADLKVLLFFPRARTKFISGVVNKKLDFRCFRRFAKIPNSSTEMLSETLKNIGAGKANTQELTENNGDWSLPSMPWYIVVLIMFAAWGFIGNALVCLAIATEKRLQCVTNFFLFSLAITDLLVSALVMPFAILTEWNHQIWPFSVAICNVHTVEIRK